MQKATPEGEEGEAERLDLLWEALALGLGDYIEAAGCFQRVGLGLSGGRDSALGLLVAWRWAKTQGGPLHERVYAFSMPSSHSSSQTRKAAQTLAEELGVSFAEHSIEEACRCEREAVERMLGHKAHEVTLQNIQARIRAMRLWNWANSAQALFLQTGNHSEKAVGYTTLGGDLSGGFSPLSDLPKTWIARLLSHIQSRMHLEGLEQVLSMPASPELTKGQTTEAELMSFARLDILLEGLLGEGLTGESLAAFARERFCGGDDEAWRADAERVQRRVFSNQHKWRQAPPGLRLYSKSLRRFRWALGAIHWR
jgi:NAD+ synthase (glutamine-hydrolysing)